jgi:hypothetical protein
MKIVDIVARDKKEVDAIIAKITKLAKPKQTEYCDIHVSNKGRTYWIEVESPEQIADYMGDIVRKSPNANLIKEEEYPGHFDWAADTYIKDRSCVEFKMS